MYKYSPSARGFFVEGLHTSIPADAVPVPPAEHQRLMQGQAAGQCIVPGPGGAPILADPPPTPVDLPQEARRRLADSDRVVLRAYEAGIPLPEEWVSYRKALREIVSGAGPDAIPTQPGYPS